MALPLPNLDDLKYEELVDEARSLITGLYPEWTDHNPTDPGMTLIEMFAWLAEMLVYRTNQIPEQHTLSFLRLINGPSADGTPWQATVDLDEELRQTITALRQQYRTVTSADYEDLLLEVSEFVARTHCVPLRNLTLGSEQERATPKAGHVSLLFVPVAPFDRVLKFNSITVAYEEYTRMASTEDATVFSLTSELADMLYVGLEDQIFDGVDFRFETPGDAYALKFEYFSNSGGGSWITLTIPANKLMDASWNWSQDSSIWFAAPSDWTKTDIEGASAYWLRISSTTKPAIVARAKKIVPRLMQPSATLINALKQKLEPRRLLTTRQHIVGPIYVPVSFDILVASRSDVRADDLRKQIINSLIAYLDPLTGGAEGTGWPFGRAIYISELYTLLESISGVDYLPDMYLSSQCDAGAARCVNARESWHDNGEFIGLKLADHHLPQVHIQAEKIIIAESFIPVQISISLTPTATSDAPMVYRQVKRAIKAYFHPLYGTAAADWRNNSWFVDKAELVTVLRNLPEVDENQAITVQLQRDPDLNRVEFPVLTLADVRMNVTLVTGILGR
jgi:hypothetical protein